jgi:hypothetical protein
MARLPPELTDIIIGLLSDDEAALRACSLVRKDWVPPSRCRLFSAITLKGSPQLTNALVELLTSPSSTIARYVHTVELQSFGDTLEPLSTIARTLEKLVGVETLILVGWWSSAQMCEIECLSMWFAKITTLALDLWIFNSFTFLCLFRSLRVLRLRSGHDPPAEANDSTLNLLSSLRAIDLHCGMRWLAWLNTYAKSLALRELRLSESYAGIEGLQCLQRMLHSSGPSIQLLDIFIGYHAEGELICLRPTHLGFTLPFRCGDQDVAASRSIVPP